MASAYAERMTPEGPSPLPLAPTPITCIQPGGGFGFRLAQCWGRWRRALLRCFRPGYARRAAAALQPRCTDCPHDLVDARDVKWFRNVCCVQLPVERDPLRQKGWLPFARAGLTELALYSLLFFIPACACGVLALTLNPWLWLPAGLFFAFFLFIVSFFRDPQRVIPTDPQALVSPADGTITHIEEVDEADFPAKRALRVSIFLSVFNVHVNRVPRSGQILGIRYFPGCFLDARVHECAQRNEQLWIDVGEGLPGRFVRVKQIAGAIARRIVCWLKPGEAVQAGERYGMIKFGSRTDVLVPAEAVKEVLIRVGDSVRGGSSVLLRLEALEV